jgi:hypothetical protein
MNRSQRAFRCLWRANAVLIFVAAGAVTVGAGALVAGFLLDLATTEQGPPSGLIQAGPEAASNLFLTQATLLPGTRVMRASLMVDRASGGYGSSGGASDTRNLLFVEAGDKAARWLLPDNRQVIVDSTDIMAGDCDAKLKRIVAVAALVKPSAEQRDVAKGQLLLADPSARRIVKVADGVRRLHVASLLDGEVWLLYERGRHLVRVSFDGASLAKRGEEQVDVPPLEQVTTP